MWERITSPSRSLVKEIEGFGGEQGDDSSSPGEITHAQEFPHDEDIRRH
jgi:hypothetical protein